MAKAVGVVVDVDEVPVDFYGYGYAAALLYMAAAALYMAAALFYMAYGHAPCAAPC